MLTRLLLIAVSLALLAGCAKPPETELRETRSIVAHAYAAGASRLAAGEYQLANAALQRAEQLVVEGRYRKAKLTLDLAQRYAEEATQLIAQRKAEFQQELERQRQELLAAEQARKEREEKEARARREREKKTRKTIDKKPKKKPAPPKVKPQPKPVLVDRIEVAPGEDLAKIALRPEVYQDEHLWPLIYKANRDQIKDPQEIFPGQMLLIPRDKSEEEKAAARQEALELDLF